ncbi:MAG TPA: OsmC family protein [Kiritimatiellia bacterium]|nr:OsmC family protein [Kiritimatiellia bacterium]
MTATVNKFVNGVNTEALSETIEAIHQNPEIANFKFRANNRHIAGGLNRSYIKGFYGALAEHRIDKMAFVVDNDEPPVLLSADNAPNPAEYIVQALLACMTTTTIYRAAGQGIEIESIRSEVEGDLDLQGMMDLDPDVRPGFQEIRARLIIRTKGPKDAIRNLHRTSPVFDTLSRPVPIKVDVVFED